MITIGKIREKSGLLVGVIGGALLLFILGEVIRNMGTTIEANPRGEIYGESIDELRLTELIELFTNNERQMAAQQGREFTENDAKNAEDKAWNEYVRQTLLDKEFEALGITVSEDEIDALIFGYDGMPQNQMIAQYFPDSLGQGGVDMNALNDFVAKAEANETAQNGVDQNGQPTYFSYAEFYANLREEVASQRKAMKYVTLIEKGNYVTSLEAKDDYFAKNEVKNISYIFRPYFSQETSEMTLSEEQFNTYYEAHKDDKKYEQRASRVLQYISLDIKPSDEDKERGVSKLENLKDAFIQSQQDSLFVMLNSQNKQFNRNQVYRSAMMEGAPNSYPSSMDEQFQKAEVGTVVGPYVNGDRVEMAKVLGFETEKQAWVRHILIKAGGPEISFDAAQQKADSLIEVIKANDNFAELVKEVSEDPGSIENNGEYKWFQEGQMVTEFNDFSFNQPIGTLGTVKTTYGIHIVEVLGQREAKLPRLAVVTTNVDASEGTILTVEQEAKDIWSLMDEAPEKFETIAEEQNMFVRPVTVFLETPQLNGFSASAQSQVLRFGFGKGTQAMDVSEPIKDGSRYVIVQLKKIKEEGAPDKEDARQLMETDAKNEIIAEKYINEMSSQSDITKLGQQLDLPVQNAEVKFSTGNIGNNGNEPKVAGVLFSGLKDGQTTKPIAGRQGVYVVKLVKTVEPMATTDYSASKNEITARLVSGTSRNALQSLMKYADVKDYRMQVRIGAR